MCIYNIYEIIVKKQNVNLQYLKEKLYNLNFKNNLMIVDWGKIFQNMLKLECGQEMEDRESLK